MRILLVKTSSMGDVLHTLPAVSDMIRAFPDAMIDWVVEARFSVIPTWHSGVRSVIPVSWRRWRHSPAQWLGQEMRAFLRQLRASPYDYIIDAQGLLKSALITRMAKGLRCGYSRDVAREPLASLFYQRRFSIGRDIHAVTRTRALCSRVLGYPLPESPPHFGLSQAQFSPSLVYQQQQAPYIVLCHGTTWPTKQWPMVHWRRLTQGLVAAGWRVKVAWGNQIEHQSAQTMVESTIHDDHGDACAQVLPRLDIAQMANVLANAAGVVAVDTGFAHLASALGVPLVMLYGATTHTRTGPIGNRHRVLKSDLPCSPCFKRRCHYQKQQEILSTTHSTPVLHPPCLAAIDPESVLTAFLQMGLNTRVRGTGMR